MNLFMNNNQFLKSLKLLTHPYIFVLKEGNNIETDYLDYKLLMLKIGHTERMPSPQPIKTSEVQLIKAVRSVGTTSDLNHQNPVDTPVFPNKS
jgi:hypothetical protein